MIRKCRGPNPMDDCLVLLSYVARFPDKRQTYKSLSRDTGIEQTKLHRWIADAKRDPNNSLIGRAAYKYQFDYDLHESRTGKIISAVYRGY